MKKENTLCHNCLEKYYDIISTDCSICGNLLSSCTCSTPYLDTHFVHMIFKCYRYHAGEENIANKLIYSLKTDNRADVFDFLSKELCKSLKNLNLSKDKYIITNVPRRRNSIKKYGYDHAASLAKSISRILDIEYVALLKSKNKKDQKKIHAKDERLQNANFIYKRHIKDIKGKNVILIDDIITTGASLASAAMLLHGLGARKIIGACIAIAYKDDYTPFI